MRKSVEPAHNDSRLESAPSSWALVAIGLRIRLRFFVIIASLAVGVTIWPWVRGVWERIIVKTVSWQMESAVSGDNEFFCPMDPGVISAWPAICPICNMDLITRKRTDAVMLPEGVIARMQLTPYRVQLAGIRTIAVQPLSESERAGNSSESKPTSNTETVLVPTTAVVYRGTEQLVYVEAMPGLYDCLRVELGERHGDFFYVHNGLQAGQRVVAVGAFLADAESRLNPSLSTQFFGANQQLAAPRATPLAKRSLSLQESKTKLTPTEQELVSHQRFCPVTKAPLGSMGSPVFVMVKQRKVALCCAGCKSRMLADSDELLRWLDTTLAAEQHVP